jgi:hypothetical protein
MIAGVENSSLFNELRLRLFSTIKTRLLHGYGCVTWVYLLYTGVWGRLHGYSFDTPMTNLILHSTPRASSFACHAYRDVFFVTDLMKPDGIDRPWMAIPPP